MNVLLISFFAVPAISIFISFFMPNNKSSKKMDMEVFKSEGLEKNRAYYQNLKINKDGFYSGTNSPVHGHSGGRTGKN